MSLKNYIHNLQQRPVHERKRIAFFATAVGFFLILVIWVVSFNEMNKSADQPADQTSASFNDLKMDFQQGKDSIQNMIQDLPEKTGTAEMDDIEAAAGGDDFNMDVGAEYPLEDMPKIPNDDSDAEGDFSEPPSEEFNPAEMSAEGNIQDDPGASQLP